MDRTVEEFFQAFGEPMPEEAILSYRSEGKEYTGFRAQYIIERLNQVLGLGWDFDMVKDAQGNYIYKIENGFAAVYGELTIYGENDKGETTVLKKIRQWGGAGINEEFSEDNDKNFGWPDALKSAQTNSLTKCASYLGIGADAYKGKIPNNKSSKPAPAMNTCEKIMSDIKMFCKENEIDNKKLQKLAQKALDKAEKISIPDLGENDLKLVWTAVQESVAE